MNTPAGDGKKGESNDDYPAMPNIFNRPRQFGFPPNILTRLRYNDIVTLTSTDGSLAIQQMRMNSIFDPDVTSAGHQPLYHDQFAAIYNHYTVVGSKITVTFTNTVSGAGSINGAVACGLVVGDDATFSSTFQTLCEQNKALHGTLPGFAGSAKTLTFTQTYGAVEDEGIDPYAGSSLVRTAMGANPTEVYFAQAWVQGIAGADGVIAVDFNIEYTVLFSELIDVAQS